MNYAAALPDCRAFVHHGGAGTTNAGLRAGLPTLILWTLPDQAAWGARVKRLKVGAGRRFSATTEKSLVADLRTVLDPQCLIRARALGARMTRSAESVAAAADLVEDFARLSVLADRRRQAARSQQPQRVNPGRGRSLPPHRLPVPRVWSTRRLRGSHHGMPECCRR